MASTFDVNRMFHLFKFDPTVERWKPVEEIRKEIVKRWHEKSNPFDASKKQNVDKDNSLQIERKNRNKDSVLDSSQNEQENKKRKLSDDSDDEIEIGGGIVLNGIEKKKRPKKKSKLSPAEKLAAQKEEQINHFKKQHEIITKGTDIPDPIPTFEELETHYQIAPYILENVKRMGFEKPTPVQMQVIPLMVERREMFVTAPTGSGKTAAFFIPILNYLKEPCSQGIRAVIISHTRELASQTYRECLRLADGSGMEIQLISKCKNPEKIFGPASMNKFDILITTPQRLINLLEMEPPVINLKSVKWLIIDEYDKLFETGINGFRSQLAVIYNACDSNSIKRGLFSATYNYEIEQWCKLNLDNLISVYVGKRNSAIKSVEQKLECVGMEAGKICSVRNYVVEGFYPPMIVFVDSKERAKKVCEDISAQVKKPVDVIHSDLTEQERNDVMERLRLRKTHILVCTDILSRGIDFEGINVKLIINYDLPKTQEDYIHRIVNKLYNYIRAKGMGGLLSNSDLAYLVFLAMKLVIVKSHFTTYVWDFTTTSFMRLEKQGRTGRAGGSGHAITFYTYDEMYKKKLNRVIHVMQQGGWEVNKELCKSKKQLRKEWQNKNWNRKSWKRRPRKQVKEDKTKKSDEIKQKKSKKVKRNKENENEDLVKLGRQKRKKEAKKAKQKKGKGKKTNEK